MNAIEIAERKGGETLWQGTDTQGRRVYSVTADQEGVAVEPASGWQHTRKDAGWQESKKLTITLTGRPPVKITVDDWPEIAKATDSRWDNEYEFQANRTSKAAIRVRQHADGRTIVYGSYSYDTHYQGEPRREIRGGKMLDAPLDGVTLDIADAIEDVAEQLAERVGEDNYGLDLVELGQQCIADLPAVEV